MQHDQKRFTSELKVEADKKKNNRKKITYRHTRLVARNPMTRAKEDNLRGQKWINPTSAGCAFSCDFSRFNGKNKKMKVGRGSKLPLVPQQSGVSPDVVDVVAQGKREGSIDHRLWNPTLRHTIARLQRHRANQINTFTLRFVSSNH